MLSVETFTRITKYRTGQEARLAETAKFIAENHIHKVKVQESNGNWHNKLVVMPKEKANILGNIIEALQNKGK